MVNKTNTGTFVLLYQIDGIIDVPNSHWLVDENRGVWTNPFKQQVSMMINGISQLPAQTYFYHNDVHFFTKIVSFDPEEGWRIYLITKHVNSITTYTME